ncbi:hypothetical protein [Falsiroseomonas selenitidurans]|uniref:Secreted protein n=1 Tax=Falsiroseomonas selenitidurans TaxID=2716335 RepID=A0ABX1E1U8_9PROT|nr:hypothetical protein [Falsiroseomonas selenitidurans]NKC29798.1 hypothetical protein [Falsiroseomonas selenitidurans]
MRHRLAAMLLGLLPGLAMAQQPPSCAASGYTPLRSAAEVTADVARHRCPPGSRLDVAMTTAGQALVLQRDGLCQPDSVRTRTVRPTPETRALGLRCDLAAR